MAAVTPSGGREGILFRACSSAIRAAAHRIALVTVVAPLCRALLIPQVIWGHPFVLSVGMGPIRERAQ